MGYYQDIAGNPLQRDCHDLAVDVIATMRIVQREHKEFDLTRQLIRSVLSIGSNLAESKGANSTDMLVSKMEIAYREVCESRFQVSVLVESDLLEREVGADLDRRLDSLAARLYSGIRRLRTENNNHGEHSRFR